MRVYLRVRPFSKEELSDSQDQVGNSGPEGQVKGAPATTLAAHRSRQRHFKSFYKGKCGLLGLRGD